MNSGFDWAMRAVWKRRANVTRVASFNCCNWRRNGRKRQPKLSAVGPKSPVDQSAFELMDYTRCGHVWEHAMPVEFADLIRRDANRRTADFEIPEIDLGPRTPCRAMTDDPAFSSPLRPSTTRLIISSPAR